MAPTIAAIANLAARYTYYCPSGYYYRDGYCYSRSRWNRYGRWILLAIVVVFFFAILGLLALRTRRRRSQGRPMAYGTGWISGRPNGGAPSQPAPQYSANYATAPPPPEYSQQPPQGYQQPHKPFEGQTTGTTYDSNQGYYGNGQPQANGQGPNDIQLQQPSQAYYPARSGAADDYAPPEGPPPAKH